jgi:quercetin dioxygenase-like cupin family protein
MRIIAPTRRQCHWLQCCSEARDVSGQSHAIKDQKYGHQTSRLTAFRQGAGGLVHRDRAHRPLFGPPEPARAGGALVTFEPGARTAWHTHPLGQTLFVTAGCGWVQRDGGPVEVIRPGDVIWFPPGEKHWHGATATTAMSHIAVQEKLNGSPVDWLEHVTDEQYGQGVER